MIKRARIFRIALGVFLILFGTIGHLVPLFPGTYFIVAGILLLAEAVPAVRARVEQMENRYPVLHNAIARVRSPDGSLNLPRIALLSLALVLVFGTVLFFVLRLLQNN